jgi:CubicO group peptidase (beta-lactamase class C family)
MPSLSTCRTVTTVGRLWKLRRLRGCVAAWSGCLQGAGALARVGLGRWVPARENVTKAAKPSGSPGCTVAGSSAPSCSGDGFGQRSPVCPTPHHQAKAAAGRLRGAAWHGWRRLGGALLVCLLAAACTSPDGRQGTATSRPPSAGPTQRDYWPTAGWRTAAPNQQGMDPQVLDDLDTQVPERYPQVRSLLVVRHGYLVYEHYWQGFDAADGQEIHSVTKSITSALVGIALGQQRLKSLDQTVGELLAAHLPKHVDPRVRAVTVRQLLTMTGGLPGDDPSTGGDVRLSTRLFRSRDWLGHILGRPLADKPGTTWAYSNASSHLLSAIVADTTGRSTLAYARAKLFGPLGIHSDNTFQPRAERLTATPAQQQAYQQAAVAWPRDPQGYHFGFGETKLPPRDLAKLGYLYLNDGRWDTTQVVPADYVRASTQPHSKPYGPVGYGYQWWTDSVNLHASFLASGFGGQRIQVVPDLDLVVVITTDAQQQRGDAEDLVGQTIIPAVTD